MNDQVVYKMLENVQQRIDTLLDNNLSPDSREIVNIVNSLLIISSVLLSDLSNMKRKFVQYKSASLNPIIGQI
jgi:hypothetical protein